MLMLRKQEIQSKKRQQPPKLIVSMHALKSSMVIKTAQKQKQNQVRKPLIRF